MKILKNISKIIFPNFKCLNCGKECFSIPTPSQTELSYLERKENIKNSILPKSVNIQNSNILLIDDVYTTGATTEDVSRVLYKMGASKVVVLTLACTRSDEALN